MRMKLLAATAVAWTALSVAASAQDLPKHHFKVLIQDSPTPHVKLLEAPLWNEWIPAASKGQITADAAPYDQVGIPDDAVLRLLKLGAFDFASFDIAKVAGDDPKFEGCDLAGLTLTFADARKGCEAWRETVDKLMQQKWNAKLLALGTAPPQAIWCATEVKNFDDLKGKKLRVFTKTMVDFAQGIGAAPVNISFREVDPGAAEQGGGLRRDRHGGRQCRRLDRGHQVPDAAFARLGDQRARRQPAAPGSGSIRRCRRSWRASTRSSRTSSGRS